MYLKHIATEPKLLISIYYLQKFGAFKSADIVNKVVNISSKKFLCIDQHICNIA